MAMYMVIEVEVLDADACAEHVERVPATVEKCGGRHVVRGGPVVSLTGDWRPERVVILEFPAMEQMQRWSSSPEYLELAPIRKRSAKTRAIALDGYRGELGRR